MKKRFAKRLVVISTLAMLTFNPYTKVFAAGDQFTTHTVVSGESLWKISVKYDVSIQEIMQANNLSSANLAVGQQLKIPVKSSDNVMVYTVKSGDVLWKIAATYNVSVQDIIAYNGLDPSKYLYVGQKLYIPTSMPAQTNTPPSGDYIVHTVESGDVLWKIAARYNVTTKQIVAFNKIDPNIPLMIGQKLYIPNIQDDTSSQPKNEQVIHIVQSGESIWKISIKYRIDEQDILKANGLSEASIIYPGQKLIIPQSNEQQLKPNVPSADNTQPYITYIEHTVQAGDTPWNLSIKYGIPYTEMKEVNNFTGKTMLTIGQKVTIPVHHIPVTATPGPQYGEYLDWWTQAQYLFPIGAKAKVTDLTTGKSYKVIRSFGAFHADCEPLTAQDAAIMYEIWRNQWSWVPRAAIVEVDGRKIAASVTNMPHDVQNIKDNNFNGHFDVHFLNSKRHKDGLVNEDHQVQIKIAAGVR
jgi:LysM repeat protein